MRRIATLVLVATTTALPAIGADGFPPPLAEGEREVLQEFYEATGGGHWNFETVWDSSSEDPCSDWSGVYCDIRTDGDEDRFHVVGLDLSGHGLTGKLPSRLFTLPHLEALELAWNPELSGRIPDSYVDAWASGKVALRAHGTSLENLPTRVEISGSSPSMLCTNSPDDDEVFGAARHRVILRRTGEIEAYTRECRPERERETYCLRRKGRFHESLLPLVLLARDAGFFEMSSEYWPEVIFVTHALFIDLTIELEGASHTVQSYRASGPPGLLNLRDVVRGLTTSAEWLEKSELESCSWEPSSDP